MNARACLVLWGGLCGSLAAVSCSSKSDGDRGLPTFVAGGGGQDGAGGGLFGGGGPGPGCSPGAELVYVLSDANQLYSFQPDEKLFRLVGTLTCETTMLPNSMAIDRNAVAWVNYVQASGTTDIAGALFRVSTADASCEPTPSVELPMGWHRLGMSFSSDAVDSDAESLYVTSVGLGGALGRVDDAIIVPVGDFTGRFAGHNAELTGTGDARLFGFFTTSPVTLAELDKADASAVGETQLPTIPVPMAWAFSFWGGDFYLYTATTGSSQVSRHRPSDGSVDTAYVVDVGFRIVGAGVSTCAPLEPPT